MLSPDLVSYQVAQFIGLEQLGGPITAELDSVTELYLTADRTSFRKKLQRDKVVMVVRPLVGTFKNVGGFGKAWVKAQVILETKEASEQLE